MWDCPGKGVELKPLPGSPRPADSGAARLRQMKALAVEFSGQTIDRQGKTLDLRVLPTPLYRYEAAGPGPIDGALFALVQETDPEALLLLEASAEGDREGWRYAAGSFTNLGLRLGRAGMDLWADPQADRLTGTRGSHVGFVVEKIEGGPDSPAASKPPGAGG